MLYNVLKCSSFLLINWYTHTYHINLFSHRQQGQDTKEEVASRDLRSELESRERESKEKKESKTRSFTGKLQLACGLSMYTYIYEYNWPLFFALFY